MPLVLVKAVNGRQHPFQKQTATNRQRCTALLQGGEKLTAGRAGSWANGVQAHACQPDRHVQR